MSATNITRVDDELLHAYVDGEVSQAQRERVEAYLTEHPAALSRVRIYLRHEAALKLLYDSVMDEPIPERLLDTVIQWPAQMPTQTNEKHRG